MFLGTVAVGAIFNTSILVVAIVSASIGGFVHELFQSGGSVAYPQLKQDGLYLGSVSGLLFGAVAGMLVVNDLPAATVINTAFVSQLFFAGLALKGVAEAAGGQARGQSPTK